MHSGKLWAPEGFGFTPDCQSWWSLLVRQARLFRQMSERERQTDIALQGMRAGATVHPAAGPSARRSGDGPQTDEPGPPVAVGGRAAKPSGLNLSS